MAEDPLGTLFDRYRREGDLAALARVFEAVGPELLRLARHLQPRGQAPEDLVQSTFLAALTHRERYVAGRPIRPWLLGILLNKAASGRRPERELTGEVPGASSPEDEAEALESARLLARGLERLPAVYSEVLREHFFAGLPPGAIAARLGRPPGTVRAQLHRGLRLLRGLLPAGMAGWLVWLGPARSQLLRVRRVVLDQAATELESVSVQPGAPPLAGARLAGASALAVAGALGLRAWSAEPAVGVSPNRATPNVVAEADSKMRTPPAPVSLPRDAVLASPGVSTEASAIHGDLVVRVLFADGSPAAGVGLRVHAWGESSWRDNREDGVTDVAGELRLERVHAGRVGIYCDRGGDEGFGAQVAVGELTVREIKLPRGVEVEGEVVDARGVPVAGAGIWLSESPLPGAGRIAAQCDALGRFELRDVSPRRFLGARAEGYAPSDVEWLASGGLREGGATKLRLVLREGGASIAGTVLDPFGAPVPGALVLARTPLARAQRLRADGAMLGTSTPLEATADARGRFAFASLAFEELELVARAPGHPEHVLSVQLSRAAPHDDVELRLPAGGRVRGTVRYPDGTPAIGAVVIATNGAHHPVDREVDERGEFALDAVPPGTVLLQAGFGHAGGGQLVQEELWVAPDSEHTWEAVVERPSDYEGRIVSARGEPLVGAWLRAVRADELHVQEPLPASDAALAAWLSGWSDRYLMRALDQVAADAEGRFELSGVPQPFAIEVRLPDQRTGWPVQVFEPPVPAGELALAAGAQNSGGLSGSLVAPDGRALACGEVYAVRRAGGDVRRFLDASGAFRFDALPPGTFDVLVWARGHRPRVVVTTTVAEGEQRDLGSLQLAP
jgi:RNA polymerase sigma-70 factor (ECF subfamily)